MSNEQKVTSNEQKVKNNKQREKGFTLPSDAGNTTFKIIYLKSYVSILTLSTKDNVKLTKQLSELFKRSVYWNQCKTAMESKNADDSNSTRPKIGATVQGV